jgi:hypothetical protein
VNRCFVKLWNDHAAICIAANVKSVGELLALNSLQRWKSLVKVGAVNKEGQNLTSIIRLELIMYDTYVDHDTPPDKQ